MRRFQLLVGTAAALFAATVLPAAAQQRHYHHHHHHGALIGVLECTGGPSAGYLIGSVTNLNCMLMRNGRRIEPYSAQIRRVGFDVGYTDRWVLAWEVYGPSPRIAPGGLAGSYGGAGASASVGHGAAQNQLIGGAGTAFSLVPLETNAQQGVNLAFGFEGMDLVPARY